jgi:hypothetical protein
MINILKKILKRRNKARKLSFTGIKEFGEFSPRIQKALIRIFGENRKGGSFICFKCGCVNSCADFKKTSLKCVNCHQEIPVPATGISPGVIIGECVVSSLHELTERTVNLFAFDEDGNKRIIKILHPELAKQSGFLFSFISCAMDSVEHDKILGFGEDNGLWYKICNTDSIVKTEMSASVKKKEILTALFLDHFAAMEIPGYVNSSEIRELWLVMMFEKAKNILRREDERRKKEDNEPLNTPRSKLRKQSDFNLNIKNDKIQYYAGKNKSQMTWTQTVEKKILDFMEINSGIVET